MSGNLTLPPDLITKMVQWGRAHRDVASILFVEGDSHYVMDCSEEYALFMHKHLLDPYPIEVKGGYANPTLPTKVNMMRVICHPDRMDSVKPEVAECVKGLAAYAQSLPTTTRGRKRPLTACLGLTSWRRAPIRRQGSMCSWKPWI